MRERERPEPSPWVSRLKRDHVSVLLLYQKEKFLFGKLTTNTTKTVQTLRRSGEGLAKAALDGAHAGTVGTNITDASDDGTSSTSRGSGVGRRSRGGRSISRRSVGLGGRGVAGDGAAVSGAVLGDGHSLEHGVRLLGSGVDGEGHALAAVVALTAVKPFRIYQYTGWLTGCGFER